jgi:uncharacterized protein YfaT (DUF1175 family)
MYLNSYQKLMQIIDMAQCQNENINPLFIQFYHFMS